MNIAFISYWGIADGLTQSTVIPHVRMLSAIPNIQKIILLTIERKDFYVLKDEDKIIHIPLQSKNFKNVILNKVSDYIIFYRDIIKIVKAFQIDLLICRSSLAGGIGFLVSTRTSVPYIVESFEPHADYMVESGVWSKYDLRTFVEGYFQRKQIITAKYLLPVANNYRNRLIKQEVDIKKIMVVPCVTNLQTFVRNENYEIRRGLGLENKVVGVYVGKFGGIYYDDEAFQVFALSKKVFSNFCILILTPGDKDEIKLKLLKAGFLENEFRILSVTHSEVPEYLSVSDFAFATYKPSDSKKYLSPIKIGEYWACGLPVLLTKGVGDDSDIIEKTGCGATFNNLDKNEILKALDLIRKQLERMSVREENRQLAEKYRNPNILRVAYEKVIASLA